MQFSYELTAFLMRKGLKDRFLRHSDRIFVVMFGIRVAVKKLWFVDLESKAASVLRPSTVAPSAGKAYIAAQKI